MPCGYNVREFTMPPIKAIITQYGYMRNDFVRKGYLVSNLTCVDCLSRTIWRKQNRPSETLADRQVFLPPASAIGGSSCQKGSQRCGLP